MYSEDARVFKFVIPSEIDDDVGSVLIKASAYRGSSRDFSMKVYKEGSEMKSRDGISAWKKGKVVRINKADFYGWCKGCEIKILIDVKDSGYYHIMAQTTESYPLLSNNV